MDRYATGPRSFGAACWIPGVKTEKTAKKRRKNEQKWARYSHLKRVRAALLCLRNRYNSVQAPIQRMVPWLDKYIRHSFRYLMKRWEKKEGSAPETYVATLRQQPDSFQCVMVIGHNPGLEQLVGMLTGADEPFPTAALAVVELELASWSELHLNAAARLVRLWLPRELE